jgi:hypothetical protein
VKVIGQDLKDSSEDTVFAPLLKAPVHGGGGSVTLRQNEVTQANPRTTYRLLGI